MKLLKTMVLSSLLASSAVMATTPPPIASSGILSVVAGQNASLHLLNLGPSTSSCSVTLSLLDDQGNILVGGSTASVITGGTTVTISTPVATTSGLVRAQLDFTPQTTVTTTTGNPLVSCNQVIPTLEIMGALGTTILDNRFLGMPNFKNEGILPIHEHYRLSGGNTTGTGTAGTYIGGGHNQGFGGHH